MTITIKGLGPVLFERSQRAKHLNISVMPFTGVRIAVPSRMSFQQAEDLAYTKIYWMKKHLQRMKLAEEEQKAILKKRAGMDRVTAKKKLVERLNALTDKHGLSYNKVFVKNQKTIWGSCSTKNNINLNRKLLMLPDELVDYVILHELVHTRIKNHSKRFWTALDKLVSDAKKVDQRLKGYGLGL